MCPDLEQCPLVSIGIPTYNRPFLLQRAINCTLAQTYRNLEIIVSDNCSTVPEVKTVIKEYEGKHDRLKIFVQPQNMGPNNNAKFILDQAAGKYFMWLCDDDMISERFIEETVNFLEANSDYSMASGVPFWIDQADGKTGPLAMLNLENSNKCKRIFNYILNVGDNSVCYSLMRKNQIDYIWPLPDYCGNDWQLVSRMLYLGKSKIVADASFFKDNAGMSMKDKKAFAANYNSQVFWIKHTTLNFYRHVMKDIFRSDYFGRGILRKTESFLYFSAVCFYRELYLFCEKWIYSLLYRRGIKRYFFHIFYLLLPAGAFNHLRNLKRKTAALFNKLFKLR